MYNILKNSTYPYLFKNLMKGYYSLVSEISETEEVYLKNNKLIVVVKDENLGERIYEILKSLKENKETIDTKRLTFKIDKYYIDKQNRVKMFCIRFSLDGKWTELSEIEKLMIMVEFIETMKNKGYVLDNSKFESQKSESICNFLSFFTLGGEELEKNIKGCIIKHIHYVLSYGGDLEQFYARIVYNNLMLYISEFPYALPVIQMCYKYFVRNSVPDDICDVLRKESLEREINNQYNNYYNNCLIVNESNIAANFAVIENNDEYTIYDGNIKIYRNMSQEFEEFLKDDKNFIKNNMDESIEQLGTKIIDFNGNIIGHKFTMQNIPSAYKITEINFQNECNILIAISAICTYVFEKIPSRFSSCSFKMENNFNCKKSLVIFPSKKVKVTTIRELYNLIAYDKNFLKLNIINLFFELYLSYLKSKYGQMDNAKQFLSVPEVRYLSPILARELIYKSLQKDVDYIASITELFNFLCETKFSYKLGYNYDSRFEYDPSEIPFSFDYELEEKYGIKIKAGMYEKLPDGRTLITFKKRKTISSVKIIQEDAINQIHEYFGVFEDENVKIIRMCEIVYTKDIDDTTGIYYVKGYILKIGKARLLTDDVFLSLSNKDFLKVIGYLLSKFIKRYIPLTTIWMDDVFGFYINVLDENFDIKEVKYLFKGGDFINGFISHMIQKGYNPYSFLDLDFTGNSSSYIKTYVLRQANKYNKYCPKHQLYYNEEYSMCPVCEKITSIIPRNFAKEARLIFEDSYAKHYRYGILNLKVYKKYCFETSDFDFSKVERNIDTIITNRVLSENNLDMRYNLGQSCFIPLKKAVFKNNEFVGYIYPPEIFKNSNNGDNSACVDLEDSEALQNLARIKSLIRLILQVKEITENGFSFIYNPFGNVFLNKIYKKQVQIANIEFLSKEGDIENTIKWTYNYVISVINSDETIEIDIDSDRNADVESLDYILTKLQMASEKMTKYCSFHKIYYKDSNLFCPKCVSKSEMRNIEVIRTEIDSITSNKVFDKGGESTIYYYENDSVAKVFNYEVVNYNLKTRVIARVLSKKKILERINNANLKYKYVIIQKVLIDSKTGNMFGYIMDKAINSYPLSSLRDKGIVNELGFTRKDVMEILITVGQGIETLHNKANIYIGDLNGRNILFDIEKNVYFLEFDGVGIDEIKPEFWTVGYIDPSSIKNGVNITMKDDWYSFAVQAFYYLTYTHPFHGIYYGTRSGKSLKEISDRMEYKISLLGKHDIEIPDVAEPWDWMDKELTQSFLDTFEGDRRESIVPYLVKQYEKLYSDSVPKNLVSENDMTNNNTIRINPKFIAKVINPFNTEVIRVINHYSAICKKSDGNNVVIILDENNQIILENIHFPDLMDIKDILLSDNRNIVIAVYENKVIAVDLQINDKIYSEQIPSTANIVLNDNIMYFNGVSEGENVIFERRFEANQVVEKRKMRFLTKATTKRFLAKFNSKFVMIKATLSDDVDDIYCNTHKFFTMQGVSKDSKYNIVYDNVTKSFLVINSDGNGIIIYTSNGKGIKLNIKESIDGNNIENISYYKGNIYVPSQNLLYIINTNNDQLTTKKMECNKVITPNSRLFDINHDGFSIITDNILYEIRRG